MMYTSTRCVFDDVQFDNVCVAPVQGGRALLERIHLRGERELRTTRDEACACKRPDKALPRAFEQVFPICQLRTQRRHPRVKIHESRATFDNPAELALLRRATADCSSVASALAISCSARVKSAWPHSPVTGSNRI